MVKKCIHCQGTLKRGKAPIHIDREGCHVTIDNVPAWICARCGESLFKEQEVEAIQRIVKALGEECRSPRRSARVEYAELPGK